jgi:4-hydroxy-tetrahydrodipicolinate reductase
MLIFKKDYMRTDFGKVFTMIKLCVAGAGGRMGTAIIREIKSKGHQLVGAIEASNSPHIGKNLRELGITNQDITILDAKRIDQAIKDADVYLTFTTPQAELQNIPKVVALNKKIVLGTTGFNQNQTEKIREMVLNKVPTVFSPNYSVGITIFFKIVNELKKFPNNYDFSINEIHHTGKKDAPSGTAKKLGKIIANIRNYNKNIYGREGFNPRKSGELEISSLRAGGVPGIHDLIIAGPYEMLRLEHIAFSRDVFAQGAVYAAEWLTQQTEKVIFNMEHVLDIS